MRCLDQPAVVRRQSRKRNLAKPHLIVRTFSVQQQRRGRKQHRHRQDQERSRLRRRPNQ